MQQEANMRVKRDNQLAELSNNYQTLKQSNLESMRLISDLKMEINRLNV